MFNVHENVTADGVVVVTGLRVRTNDWTIGVVTTDRNQDRSTGCCYNAAHRGQKRGGDGRTWFTDHDTAERHDCNSGCRHNHWYTVKFDDGTTKEYDGERLGARNLEGESEGRFAAWMHEIDQWFFRRYGFDTSTCDDWTWEDAFDRGDTPEQARQSYFESIGEGEF